MLIDNKSLPTTKQESWKYTNIASIYEKNNIKELLIESPNSKDYLEGFKFDTQENVVIILDGILAIDYNKKLNHISALELHKDDRNMSRLAIENSKHFGINIAKDTKDYLSLIFINTDMAKNKLTNISLKLDVDMFASLDLDIDFVNLTENSAINLYFDINVAEAAKVNFTNNSNNPNNSKLITTANYLINLDRAAEFNGFNLLNKDALLRNDFVVNLNKPHSKFDVRGLYLINDSAIANTCFLVNHNASHTYSNVNFRGVANGNAKAWFNAKAIVNKGIEQIQAYQNNKNIQLSNKAEINTKPELEIFADDVVCTHGATIGQLDKDALFYLQSRGLELHDAQHLLLESFVKSQLTSDDFPFENEIKEEIVESLKDILHSII
ncbi:Fe-S cluster assembly protein SufD [Francisella tularensis]|uniref:Fe-S cluster assembly protein SufD n=1 Tax=Francisella tularensis TaxID=263 RepID=UPI000173E5B6|nr:Fe-S cluster assembly protein SufD [Francisella tularensis]ACD30900.1 SufS activator complex, sufD subunit [Francisella tularensis subsp. mediasiatica FSC147]MBK2077828.1 Fe-S cluster assembly protein SufD [Francisella tularensis subsp. mediasiatica]MBK2101981.1 Fe-S cluster assembly protein SufD [Francisella tularensis subsp. mediasiatica]MBK2103959.1 Fe-S cluster assembly protein SufD [Francisella tularensis subsp. mediasiatica]MDN9003323.1 Fe-S cluster assembly protein SufD [Francisella 